MMGRGEGYGWEKREVHGGWRVIGCEKGRDMGGKRCGVKGLKRGRFMGVKRGRVTGGKWGRFKVRKGGKFWVGKWEGYGG